MFSLHQYSDTIVGVWISSMEPLLAGDTKCRNGTMTERLAAHWVKSDYQYNSSITSMLADLQWPSLQHR